MTDFARRDFLRGAAAVPFAEPLFGGTPAAKSCILLILTGGPSHLDTWDPKPDAPREIRGPFKPIRTNVPGIQISEIFPRMARHADKYALIRSVYSDIAPVHEDALQAIETGAVELPGPIGFMGAYPSKSSRYPATFAESCAKALRLIETGVPFVRVNMFDTVFHRTTWDSHGTKPFSTIRDYKDTVGPAFDAAYSTLLEDLHQRGLLKTTLVLATGEFGRTPRINPQGGRDHWTKCWTAIVAGGGIQGGQIYGSSDATGSEPKDKPVNITQLIAAIQQFVGQAILSPVAT